MTLDEIVEEAVDWLTIPDAYGEYDDDGRNRNKEVIADAIQKAVAEERERVAAEIGDLNPSAEFTRQWEDAFAGDPDDFLDGVCAAFAAAIRAIDDPLP